LAIGSPTTKHDPARKGAAECDELLAIRLNSVGQRAGGPPCTLARAIGGGRTGMPQRTDVNPAELRFVEEKITRLDAVPRTGTRRLLRTRSKTFRVMIPAPL
jgi:hypothetical protein